jgi:hypothetical protein
VKFVRGNQEHLIFQLGRREHQLLVELLSLYPLTPTHHHRLSRTADAAQIDADQQLLEETMASRKAAMQHQLHGFLSEGRMLRPHGSGYEFTLPLSHSEWFLQVLNDVRIGSWLQLGCPDENHPPAVRPTRANARLFLTMELCGMFQSLLLQALDQYDGESPHGSAH